jgi:hypothetical protein
MLIMKFSSNIWVQQATLKNPQEFKTIEESPAIEPEHG